MKNVFLGEYIKQRRLDLGLTQEQLCDGICEPMTLSRLENGKQTPSRNRINALLQRLGLPDDRYFALLSKNELEMEALQKEIVACNANHRVEEGFETLKKFEQIADHDDQIAQQFILRSKVLRKQKNIWAWNLKLKELHRPPETRHITAYPIRPGLRAVPFRSHQAAVLASLQAQRQSRGQPVDWWPEQ